MLDPSGHVLTWNTGAADIKGYAPHEIIGQHFSRFYTDDDRQIRLPEIALEQAGNTGRFVTEGWRVRKDGSVFWASVVIDRIIRDDELVGFVKITRDLTEQRMEQLAALEGERRFRLLVQGVTDYAIYMLDPNGCVTNWNAGAARIKGYTQDEILGHHFSRFYTSEDVDAGVPWRALEKARSEGRYEAEGWRVRKDGTYFWASVAVDAIYDDAGKLIGFAKITRDLTERREAQIELEKSREQLFQAQKMEAIGNLTGGVAHDFNNLLTGITGNLDLIEMRVAQARFHDLDRYVGAAKGAVSRAASLTHRLLAFARRQPLDPRPTDANALIGEMVEMIQRTVGPAAIVTTAFTSDAWLSFCDANQLENAILNLCINARDAMPDGGAITIRTANTVLDGRYARERDISPGEYLVVSVVDNGTGMPPDVKARAFDPFFTTKPSGKGTGLGLSMIYGFARQSNGQAQIHSEIGHGTTIEIYLPRFIGERNAEPEPTKTSDLPSNLDKKVILVVDDDDCVRSLITEIAEELSCLVLEAADGAGGLKLINSDIDIDLLITDIGLPGNLNGQQLALAAKAARPNLQVLFITGYAEDADVLKRRANLRSQILIKPFSLDTLTQHITRVLTQ